MTRLHLAQELPQPAAEEDDEIDLLALGGVLWGGKWLIAAVLILSLLVGVAVYVKTPRTYQATSMVQVQPQSSGFAAASAITSSLFGTESSPIEGEIAIMGSRLVLGQAIDKLNLDWSAKPWSFPILGDALRHGRIPDLPGLIPTAYGRPGDSVTLGDLTVPLAWVDQPITLTDTGGDTFSLDLPDGTAVTGRVGKPVTDKARGYAILVSQLSGVAGRKYTLERLDRGTVLQSVDKAFAVAETPKGSSTLAATYSSGNPERAAAILQAITNGYVTQNIDSSSAQAQKSLEFVQSQLPDAKAAVEKAQAALTSYQDKNRTVDLTYETQALLTAETNVQESLNQLDVQEATMKQDYTPNHPVYQALMEKRQELQSQLTALQKQAATLPEAQKQVLDLTSNLNVAQQAYVDMLGRVEQLKVLSNAAVGNVRVIDVAAASTIPVSPRKLTLVLAGLLGLILGAGIVLGRHALRKGVRGAEDLERIGLPVFATVPFAKAPSARHTTRGTWPILAVADPDDPSVEAIRSLRTSLHFGMLDGGSHTVLFTSAAPEAGKSFVSTNLAVTAAQAGQKVCLVDADMRRGCLRHYLGRPRNTPGLAEVLAGDVELDAALIEGAAPGLSCLVAGRFPPNPSELLMRASFTRLLEELNARFDLVIIDSPPTLAVTDPVIIGRSAAAVIVVARHLETWPGAVQAVQKTFQSAGVKLTGSILNGYRAEKTRYGYGHGYAYNYRYSYRTAARKDG